MGDHTEDNLHSLLDSHRKGAEADSRAVDASGMLGNNKSTLPQLPLELPQLLRQDFA